MLERLPRRQVTKNLAYATVSNYFVSRPNNQTSEIIFEIHKFNRL